MTASPQKSAPARSGTCPLLLERLSPEQSAPLVIPNTPVNIRPNTRPVPELRFPQTVARSTAPGSPPTHSASQFLEHAHYGASTKDWLHCSTKSAATEPPRQSAKLKSA